MTGLRSRRGSSTARGYVPVQNLPTVGRLVENEQVTFADPTERTTVSQLSQAAEVFESNRRRLFGIAYRMLGTVADAEDIVQDAWLRWQATDRSVVLNTEAFLVTTVTRLSINAVTSARVRRESYIGPWLPELVPTGDDPSLGAERAEALSVAMLTLMEHLSPSERAVYVLREAFDYPFRQIAEVLETNEANARQLARRARDHLAGQRRAPAQRQEISRLLDAFLSAARSGNLDELERLLAQDVVSISDGGGKVTAARQPVTGRDRVARFLLGALRQFGQGATFEISDANGGSCLLIKQGSELLAMATVSSGGGVIDGIYLVRNPDKLGSVQSS